MSPSPAPTSPGVALQELLRRSEAIRDERLARAIPRECFERRTGRGLLGLAASAALYAGAIAGVVTAPHWLLYPPLWVLAGLGGWGLHCIAHDCGHNSFSPWRRFNFAVGHLALLPLAYPFHAWRHVHNLHHSHTNHLDLDTDWRPLPAAAYARLPWRGRLLYAGTRTWAYWGGTVNYWLVSGFRPGFFPKRAMRREVRRSIALVVGVLAVYLPLLARASGLRGVLLAFVAPWIATHAWFSATTLMHHSARDVPYLTAQHWTPNAARLLVTTDYVYPRWLLFLTHNISLHTAHHVAPVVPFYNLPRAQAALREAYPGMVRVRRFRPGQLWRILRRCHLYDVESGFYQELSGAKVAPTPDGPPGDGDGSRGGRSPGTPAGPAAHHPIGAPA
jgi:omega-6 fatty acid desaturase (delta-12 desaturase)